MINDFGKKTRWVSFSQTNIGYAPGFDVVVIILIVFVCGLYEADDIRTIPSLFRSKISLVHTQFQLLPWIQTLFFFSSSTSLPFYICPFRFCSFFLFCFDLFFLTPKIKPLINTTLMPDSSYLFHFRFLYSDYSKQHRLKHLKRNCSLIRPPPPPHLSLSLSLSLSHTHAHTHTHTHTPMQQTSQTVSCIYTFTHIHV